jgi:transposase InsO family protein
VTQGQKVIKAKLGLLELGKELGNVSKACKMMGYSRDSFYRFKEQFDTGGSEALQDIPRKGRANRPNRTDPAIEAKLLELSIEQPAWGQKRISNELWVHHGLRISPAGVRCVWLRHDMATMDGRLARLEAKVAQSGGILTESQKIALEEARAEGEAHGVFESEHPGYCGAQDTFYVGTLKGVGRIYQQTFIDTYSKVGFAKLYTDKTPLTAAELLNDRVVPFFETFGIRLLRVLTDRGGEFCGLRDSHAFELYLQVEEIEHTRTKAYHPQTNGICERFHKTILDEFYRIAFRTKRYERIEDLQADLDAWMTEYNEQRTHQGRWCYGRTPMQTLLETIHIAKEKTLTNEQ